MEQDRLALLWKLQAEQQEELGLNPDSMSDVERARTASDLELLLYEETAELARLSGTYKRHLLSSPRLQRAEVADAVADVLKVALAIAQLHGLSDSDVVDGFERKTLVVRERSNGERIELCRGTKVICVDLDDVICDLSEWRERLLEDAAFDAPDELSRQEGLKADFYEGGRFRSMPPIQWAREALLRIRAAGYKIVIVTARPQWQYKRLHADTIYWLEQYGIPRDLVLFDRNKVEAVYNHVAPAWPTAFIEDHGRNAQALAEVGIQVLLFDAPYNQDVADSKFIRRVHGWEGVLAALDDIRLANEVGR